MTSQEQTPEELTAFCGKCRENLNTMTENQSRIDFMRNLLPELLRQKQLIGTILAGIVERRTYPDINYPTMFDSEFILYTDPDHLFSIRMFLWGPGEYDPIHDHNSWGVIGPVTGKLEVVNYRRLDDGSREEYAHLVETDRRLVSPGDTYFVLPLNVGIHRTGNPSTDTIIQMSIYGEGQTVRDHINGYDIDSNRCYPIYAPKVRKRRLAAQACAFLDVKT